MHEVKGVHTPRGHPGALTGMGGCSYRYSYLHPTPLTHSLQIISLWRFFFLNVPHVPVGLRRGVKLLALFSPHTSAAESDWVMSSVAHAKEIVVLDGFACHTDIAVPFL